MLLSGAHPLLGEWLQIEPDPSPLSIVIRFDADGTFLYTIGAQRIALTWRIEDGTLFTSRPSGPGELTHRYRIEASRLILGANVYVRR